MADFWQSDIGQLAYVIFGFMALLSLRYCWPLFRKLFYHLSRAIFEKFGVGTKFDLLNILRDIGIKLIISIFSFVSGIPLAIFMTFFGEYVLHIEVRNNELYNIYILSLLFIPPFAAANGAVKAMNEL